MLAYISVAVLVMLPFEATTSVAIYTSQVESANSNSDNVPQFDAFFRHEPGRLSYVKASDNFRLPENIVNFTLCFWLKPSAETELTVFSYNSNPSAPNGNEVGFYQHTYEQQSELCFNGKCNKFPGPSVKLNVWQHFCILYDGSNPKVTLIYNGGQKFEKDGFMDDKNYKIRGNGKIILGQDQDTYGGGFHPEQSMRGRLSLLQLWDRLLDNHEVKQQMQCNAPEGNIIAWTRTPWQFLNGATKVLSDPCPAKPFDCVQVEEECFECVSSGAGPTERKNISLDPRTELVLHLTDLKQRIEVAEKKDVASEKEIVALQTANAVFKTEITDLKKRQHDVERELKDLKNKIVRSVTALQDVFEERETLVGD